MEKIYQVFVSSTYEDLKEERQEVMQALLELNFIPAGMELFSAADVQQWELIKRVIDGCDYFVVIVGGRYGTIGPEGYSYTEMEYRYAKEQGIPIAGFIHADRSKVDSGKTDPANAEKLDAFIQLVQQKVTKTWKTADGLKANVLISLSQMRSSSPGVGWVRGDAAIDPAESNELRKEVQDLQKENKRLEQQIAEAVGSPPAHAVGLAQGDEEVSIKFQWKGLSSITELIGIKYDMVMTWDELFGYLSPGLPAAKNEVAGRLNTCLDNYATKRYAGYIYKTRAIVDDDDFDTIRLQLVALGLISVKGIYWSLTRYGEQHMMNLRTIKRKVESDDAADPVTDD